LSLKKTKSTAPVQHDNQSATLNAAIVEALQNIKALDIVEIDLRQIKDASTDFFIVCSGTSTTHISGIADRVEKEIADKLGIMPANIEGRQAKAWILVDYFTTVIHIFSAEKRQLYSLEQLWNDGKYTRHQSESAADHVEEYFD
jgi:ribosome-associated protein